MFKVLRALADNGQTVVFISHKLPEVLELSDRATVLRDGRVTGTVKTGETSDAALCRLMVGRDVVLKVEKAPPPAHTDTILSITSLEVPADSGRSPLDGIDLDIRAGEIVGIAGLAGNGQTELVEAISGLRAISGGEISLQNTEISALGVAERRHRGLSHVPEDRGGVGLAPEASLSDNLLMGFESQPPLCKRGVLSPDAISSRSTALLQAHAVKFTSISESAGTLSGGNQQKLVLGRELDHEARLLIADQPTRGVDIGATEQIYRMLIEYRDRGNAVLLVSTDLTEILALSDRIVVMFEGRIAGEVPADSATEEQLGMLMAGGRPS